MDILYRDPGIAFPEFHAVDAASFPPPSLTETQFNERTAADYWTARAGDGALAGFLNAGPRGGRYHVSLIMVAPNYRRRGLAARLLARAEARARELGYDRLALHVRADNDAAQRVYRRFGFAFTGSRQRRFAVALDDPRLRGVSPLTVEEQAGPAGFNHPLRLFEGGVPVGSGSFSAEISGCKDFALAEAPRYLPAALAALAGLCRDGAETLYVLTVDEPTAAACAALGLATEREVLDMEKQLAPKREITIASERLDAATYIDFLRRTDLGSQYPKERFAERIEKLVRNVSISLTARDEGSKLVGVCFAITDFAYWMFVTDLGVDRDYVHQGIGKKLMARALEEAGGEKDIIVYTCPNENAVAFYEKLGMSRTDDMMMYNHVDWTDWTVE